MTFRISAHLICHEVKLSEYIDRRIDADARPDEQAAVDELWPQIQQILKRNLGEGCPFELREVKVEELPVGG